MRHISSSLLSALAVAALLACDASTPPTTAPDLVSITLDADEGVIATATGGGRYLLANTFDVQFAFSAIQRSDGRVMGHFHHKLDTGEGTFDFKGAVTCLALDPATGRAWIGGVITHNQSTDAFYQSDPVFEPGRDAWFRVVDYGQGENAIQADRTTFVGFENTPGIPTSEFYCATRPWPLGDARTHPVTEGNIQVGVR